MGSIVYLLGPDPIQYDQCTLANQWHIKMHDYELLMQGNLSLIFRILSTNMDVLTDDRGLQAAAVQQQKDIN